MKIKDRLHALRLSKGMTLKDLHEKMKELFGESLSVPYLSEIERGLSGPSIKTLERLARVYDITVSQLMMNVDSENDSLQSRLAQLPERALVAFTDFLKVIESMEHQSLDNEWINTLLKTEHRGRQPENVEGWLDIYRVLKKTLDDNTKS